jgi:hypothetical protein
MADYILSCPSCAARLKSARLLPAEELIRCPKCHAGFLPSSVEITYWVARRPDRQPQEPPSEDKELLDVYLRELGELEGNRRRTDGLFIGGAVLLAVALALALAIPGLGWQKSAPVQPESSAESTATTETSSASTPNAQTVAKGATPESLKQASQEKQIEIPALKPPLTQDFLNQWTAHTEWLLDVPLTERQRHQWQALWVEGWNSADQAKRDQFRTFADTELEWFGKIKSLDNAERDEMQAEKQSFTLAALRRSSGADDRMLLAVHDSAHQPGTARNPILVGGAPPLTHDIVAQWRRFIEWVLDLRLTEDQRQKCETLFINDWKALGQTAKDGILKVFTDGLPTQLPLLSNFSRNLLRAQRQPKYLADLRQSSGREFSNWLLAIYESAHRPGGSRNPVLASGDQVLTQDMVSRYCDFVDWVLDLRATGGLTVAQRKSLREAVAGAWMRMGKPEKDRFVKLLAGWSNVLQLDEARRVKHQRKSCDEFLAQLRHSANQDPGRWLLTLYDQEQDLAKRQAQVAR